MGKAKNSMEGGTFFLVMKIDLEIEVIVNHSELLESLLDQYKDVFKEARGLLPEFDHVTSLITKETSINIRPCRHSLQKNEIEMEV